MKVDSLLLDQAIPLNEEELDKIGLKSYTLMIITEGSERELEFLNDYCRKNGIKFISAQVNGVFGRIFNDFGK